MEQFITGYYEAAVSTKEAESLYNRLMFRIMGLKYPSYDMFGIFQQLSLQQIWHVDVANESYDTQTSLVHFPGKYPR